MIRDFQTTLIVFCVVLFFVICFLTACNQTDRTDWVAVTNYIKQRNEIAKPATLEQQERK